MPQNSTRSNNPGNFANDRDKASKAGKQAHENGNAHEFDSQEAREAGKKGGQN